MKYLVLVVLFASSSCFAEINLSETKQEQEGVEVRLFNTSSSGKMHIYSASLEEAKKSKWDGNGEPPTSLGKALAIANKHIKESLGSTKEHKVHSVEVRKNIDEMQFNNMWFYKITLVPHPFGYNEYAKHRKLVVVTMGGSIVMPTAR
ncbi:hypothetical protein ACFL0R_04490 [Pseudomonadota bacterium]